MEITSQKGLARFGIKAIRPRRHVWFTWLEAGAVLMMLFCLAMPVIIVRNVGEGALGALYVGVSEHLLIEAFCGLVALMIAAMVLTIALRQRDAAAYIFAAAFLSMGCLDMLHAIADPHADNKTFVLYHTLSSISGGALILLAAVLRMRSTLNGKWSPVGSVLNLLLAAGFMVLIGYLYDLLLPRVAIQDAGPLSFSRYTHLAHEMAAIFYAVTVMIMFRHLHQRRAFALPIVVLMALFAESAYLFGFSTMWDFHWWMWHGVKVLFYIGTLASVFAGFSMALHMVQRSHRVLARANVRLRKNQLSIRAANDEFNIRNRMAVEAMQSMNLSNALEAVARALSERCEIYRYDLVLKVAADEVDEFRRSIQIIAGRWKVEVEGPDCSDCTKMISDAVLSLKSCARENGLDAGQSICMPLIASGQSIGHLRLVMRTAKGKGVDLAKIESLVAEAGPIINNALLHHRLIAANEFRAALLRVGAQLSSTLDPKLVMESVCGESARLLDSDGALIWLPVEDGLGFELVSRCTCESGQADPEALAKWLVGSVAWRNLTRSADENRRPVMVLAENDVAASGGEANSAAHPWGAVAIFPLADETETIGIMALVRKERVPYSTGTLAKGELLAGQVRNAISNARSYHRLTEINRQLQLAEESKMRGRRLAFLGQMAASVAHEVRNPLSAMSNCLAVLRSECAGYGKVTPALDIIDDELQRLNKLTRDFLVFGRPGTAILKPVMLENVLRKVCAALQRHVAQEELPVTVEVVVHSPMRPVLFDPERLEMVLWNLMLNAAQSMDGPGRVQVHLRLGKGTFLLIVTDNGRGIASSEQSRVFEPFYTSRPSGAGLGLAIVAAFAQEWKARIRLHSRLGVGTAFFIRVPVTSDQTQEQESRELAEIQ